MKRFLQTFTLLLTALLMLLSGVDATLDHLERSSSQTDLTCYDAKGVQIAVYSGDMAVYQANMVVPPPVPLAEVHRSSTADNAVTPVHSSWF